MSYQSPRVDFPEWTETVALYRRRFPGSGVGIYAPADWARLLRALQLVQGRSVLDVGVSNGALLQMLSRSGRFERIEGIDIHVHSMLILPEGCQTHHMSVADMSKFGDDAFDSVVCMEVLEHLETPEFDAAMLELRRVVGQRLVVAVPYNEPLPLWWHDRPGGHRQRFDPARLRRTFPDALASLQKRPGGVDWILLVEGGEAVMRGFVPLTKLLATLAA